MIFWREGGGGRGQRERLGMEWKRGAQTAFCVVVVVFSNKEFCLYAFHARLQFPFRITHLHTLKHLASYPGIITTTLYGR